MSALPFKNAVLDPSVNRRIFFGPDYKQWTAGDLIENLGNYERDAKVWICDYGCDDVTTVRPIELIYGEEGQVLIA